MNLGLEFLFLVWQQIDLHIWVALGERKGGQH